MAGPEAAAVSTRTPTLAASATAPGPFPTPTDTLLPLLDEGATTWYLPDRPLVAAMRDSIVGVLAANQIEFDLGYPVQGFSPDPIYDRIYIRDTSTLLAGAGYFYPTRRLRLSVEAFLRQQYDATTAGSEDGWRAGWGAISATVGPDGVVDKATAVSDEDSHLIHAAYVVYQAGAGTAWLKKVIADQPVIDRLNAAGDWLLANRRHPATGLIQRDHTTDWGDVRFQPTDGNPTDMVAGDVVWTASIYDQALAYRAWRELAAMNSALGDRSEARRWEDEADAARRAANVYLWQPERGFYATHVHLTPLAHSFDEGEMVSIANAVAVVCGLTDEAQTATILAALEEARLEAGAAKVGLVLYPPYPAGFFAQPFMKPGEYQNGGVWDWWGGWQVLAEFEAGYSQMARLHLAQTALDWASHPGQIFEWQEVKSLNGRGGDLYAGAAGIYAQVILEGLFGVVLSNEGLTLSPRLGDWPGSVVVHQPGRGLRLRYTYQPSAAGLALAYETRDQAGSFPLRLLLPPGFGPGAVRLDGQSLAWNQISVGRDQYLKAVVPEGRHLLEVGPAMNRSVIAPAFRPYSNYAGPLE